MDFFPGVGVGSLAGQIAPSSFLAAQVNVTGVPQRNDANILHTQIPRSVRYY